MIPHPELGDGETVYRMERDWARLPDGLHLGDVAAVAVDAADHVYLFTRGDHPLIMLDPDGAVMRTFGHGLFARPHGLEIGHDGMLYCTDDGDHTVRKLSPAGVLLLELGVPGRPAPWMAGQPFHRCTHTALAPDGAIYVSDGYGNACIHKFDPSGRHLLSWGRSGAAAGEFYIPHNLVCDADGWVYVADRENHRVQVFDRAGRYETEWRGVHRPCALCADRAGRFYVGEVGPALPATLAFPNLGPRISILDGQGRLLARLGAEQAGIGGGRFIAPHGIAVDSRANIFVGEVAYQAWPATFPGEPRPATLPTLCRLTPVRS